MTELTIQQENLIEDLLDQFDFEKVLITMHHLDWKWASTKIPVSVPTINEMKSNCRRLLHTSVKSISCGSGGFEATYHPQGDAYNTETFVLKFVLTQSFTSSR